MASARWAASRAAPAPCSRSSLCSTEIAAQKKRNKRNRNRAHWPRRRRFRRAGPIAHNWPARVGYRQLAKSLRQSNPVVNAAIEMATPSMPAATVMPHTIQHISTTHSMPTEPRSSPQKQDKDLPVFFRSTIPCVCARGNRHFFVFYGKPLNGFVSLTAWDLCHRHRRYKKASNRKQHHAVHDSLCYWFHLSN